MSEEKDYVDWDKVPEGYDWVAVDHDMGLIDMYTIRPIMKSHTWSNGIDYITPPDEAIISPLPPWRESLRQRPRKDA